MCVVMVRPAGTTIARAYLKEAFRCNNDGAGFMFNDPVHNIVRGFNGWFGFRKFNKALRHCERAFPDSTFVIHMRIGTSGQRNEANCHPFSINPHAGFAHNGILRELGNADRSDTRVLVEEVLQKCPDYFWDNERMIGLLDALAHQSGSKFVLLLHTGEYFIFNEGAGHWSSDVWYSNYSYVPAKSFHKPHKPQHVAVSGPCSMCGRMLNTGAGINRHGIYICASCLTTMYNTLQIRCSTCGIWSPLTEGMVRHTATCEYCSSEFTPDDIWWQLRAYVE